MPEIQPQLHGYYYTPTIHISLLIRSTNIIVPYYFTLEMHPFHFLFIKWKFISNGWKYMCCENAMSNFKSF